MRKISLVLTCFLVSASVANAQSFNPSRGYYRAPYASGYLARPYPAYGASAGAVAGIAIGAGLLGAVVGSALSQPRPVQQVVEPVTDYTRVEHVRPRCPTGLAPDPQPIYDEYGNYLGEQLVCY